jgi:hypothetical protein
MHTDLPCAQLLISSAPGINDNQNRVWLVYWFAVAMSVRVGNIHVIAHYPWIPRFYGELVLDRIIIEFGGCHEARAIQDDVKTLLTRSIHPSYGNFKLDAVMEGNDLYVVDGDSRSVAVMVGFCDSDAVIISCDRKITPAVAAYVAGAVAGFVGSREHVGTRIMTIRDEKVLIIAYEP